MIFTGFGCIHSTAVIGGPPQHRDWRPGDPKVAPTIHPSAWIGAFVTVDCGKERSTTIGERVMCMASCHVGHDTIIGAGTEIAPMTSIGGWVEIGERVSIGQGVTIKPRVKIGDGARLGMGAVVIRDVPAGATVVGNPAMQLLKDTPRISSQSRTWTGVEFTELEVSGWEEIAEHVAA